MNKTILGLTFLTLGAIYMFCSSRPFLFPNFWRSYLYIVILGYPLGMTIITLPPLKKTLQLMIGLSVIIFLFVWCMFNLIIINETEQVFYNYCTSKGIGEAFGWLVIIMLTIVLYIKYRNKKKTYA